MKQINPINLSPTFMSSVLSQGYDYAVGRKLGLFDKDTKQMSEGRIFHAIIAELLGGPKATVVISPFENFRTKAAQEWRDSQLEGTAILKEEQYEQFKDLAKRTIDHPEVQKIIDGAELQVEVASEKSEKDSFNVKGIIDLIATKGTKVTIDWKFISTQSFDKFHKQAVWDNYDLQAATYDYLESPDKVVFVTVENQAPHRIKVWEVDETFLANGASKFGRAHDILVENNWREPTFNISNVGTLSVI